MYFLISIWLHSLQLVKSTLLFSFFIFWKNLYFLFYIFCHSFYLCPSLSDSHPRSLSILCFSFHCPVISQLLFQFVFLLLCFCFYLPVSCMYLYHLLPFFFYTCSLTLHSLSLVLSLPPLFIYLHIAFLFLLSPNLSLSIPNLISLACNIFLYACLYKFPQIVAQSFPLQLLPSLFSGLPLPICHLFLFALQLYILITVHAAHEIFRVTILQWEADMQVMQNFRNQASI